MSFIPDSEYENLVTVYIKNPHKVLPHSKVAQDLLGKFLAQRINSYNSCYADCFPFGAEDFFSNHVLTCIKRGEEYIPLTSMKVVTLERCNQYNVTFPLFHTLESASFELQKSAKKLVDECEINGKVGYIGCRTLNPSYKYDKKIRTYLRDCLSLYCVKVTEDMGISDVIITSTIPNGAYKHHLKLGFKNLCEDKIIIKDLNNTESFLQYLNEWSPETLSISKSIEHSWKNRIEIDEDQLHEIKIAS